MKYEDFLKLTDEEAENLTQEEIISIMNSIPNDIKKDNIPMYQQIPRKSNTPIVILSILIVFQLILLILFLINT